MINVIRFKECGYQNKKLVGGKSSSLGELYRLSKKGGFNIADGFSTTTILFDTFLHYNKLKQFIDTQLLTITSIDVTQITKISQEIQHKIMEGQFNQTQIDDITNAYCALKKIYNDPELAVAIRSSSISEDSQHASFAGQQDSFLNITGIENVLLHIKKCIASLYNIRAISYRLSHNIPNDEIKIAVAVQKMIRSDIASAGVGFSMDPETGYHKAIVINSAYGLGELVVSGAVTPDEIIFHKSTLSTAEDSIVSKKMGDKRIKIVYDTHGGTVEQHTNRKELENFSITDQQATTLANYILFLEHTYSALFKRPTAVDIEWAIDGMDHNIYILQTRPETVHSNRTIDTLHTYILDETGESLVTGIAVGNKISTGRINILHSFSESHLFQPGDILVTDMTTPDWEPIMKISSGIITNRGGRTCHAAIIAREMGLNAIVGTQHGTTIMKGIEHATIYCAGGETGIVYKDILSFHIEQMSVDLIPTELPFKLMMNIGNPASCFQHSMLPHSGVGLVRLEFIIGNYVKIHPRALIDYSSIDSALQSQIHTIIGHSDPLQYYITQLSRGIAKIASAFYPHDVIVRCSDFKSNEYRNLIGGNYYEPQEENPMIGWRGASRYYSTEFTDAFKLECQAIKYVRDVMNLTNVIVMIPFCRTVHECTLVLETMANYGLIRGKNGLQIYLMCEIPSNVIEADEFSHLIDGVSIGGNDLLQLILGIDRDSDKIAHLSNDRNVSYRRFIKKAIQTYQKNGVKVGFCGQQPSDSAEFCRFLIGCGIDSISVTPDSILQVLHNI